jgi:predicted transglutaminase-like cysteine proteinase
MRGLKGLPGLFSTLSFLLPLTLAAAPAAANPSTEPAFISALELPNARSIDPVVGEMFPRWMSVRIYLNGEHPGDADMTELTRWAQAMRDMPVTTRLRAINMKVNNLISYATDSELWHEADYWETPDQAVERGAADCEGFAILKMYLAKEAGIPLDQMAILVGTLGYARVPHAILGAKVGQIIVTLDNKTGSIVALNNRTDFTPIYSVGVRGAYTYPTNWAASVGVTTDQPVTPVATGVSVTAADSNAHAVLRPASAAIEDTAEPAVDAEPAAVETDTDFIGSKAIAESLDAEPLLPAKPTKATDVPAVVVAEEQEKPEHQLFSSDFDTKLDQVVSLLLR